MVFEFMIIKDDLSHPERRDAFHDVVGGGVNPTGVLLKVCTLFFKKQTLLRGFLLYL